MMVEDIEMDKEIREIRDRMRRTETGVTKLAVHFGVDDTANKPEFSNGTLSLPSPHCSVKSCVDAIPRGYDGTVRLVVGDDEVAFLLL